MKIAILTPGGVDREGGQRIIPCLVWLIERLSGAGHEVHVFAVRQEPQPGTWPLAGAIVHNAGRRPRHLRLIAALLREHRNGRFDVLHAFWSQLGSLGALASKLMRVPLVVTLPGGDPVQIPDIGYGGRLTLIGKAHLRIAVLGASRTTVPSEFMRTMTSRLGIETTAVPLGVSLDSWPPSPPRRRDLERPVRLLHVASLNRVKDQTTLLQAMALLKTRDVDFVLNVVGVDTLDKAIQALANQLGLGAAVTFTGFLPQSALRQECARSDLLVMSSRHEAGPVVMLEAALAGVPTVGTWVGHIADRSPIAALAVAVGQPAALADAVETLTRDEERRLAMATAAQAFAVRYDAAFTARSFQAIYREVAAT